MRPRYSGDYLSRIYDGESVFDLWGLLTTLERHVRLPERSWLSPAEAGCHVKVEEN